MSSTSDSACRSALRALAGGRLAAWAGLRDCASADAEDALGPSVAGPALANAWGRARRHPGGAGTPHGVDVWLEGDRLITLEVVRPRLAEPLTATLGAPEAKLDSGLSSEWQQWIYCSRGLTAHVARSNGEVEILFGYLPMTISDFTKSAVARVRNEEYPLD